MGFAVIVNPLADFYTKYYITVIAILWATSFSLLILFFPKVQAFYQFKWKQRKNLQEEKQMSAFSFLQDPSDVLNLDQILGSDEPILEQRRKPSAVSTTSTATDGCKFIEVHEGEIPIRKAFRYFPFLSQWEMHHIMVFPWLGYFSHFSVSLSKKKKLAHSHTYNYRKVLKRELWCHIIMSLFILQS